jgi:signal peptidase I
MHTDRVEPGRVSTRLEAAGRRDGIWQRMWTDLRSSVAKQIQLVVAIAGCIVLIGTFGIQVVRVEGLSMAPTINDRDRLIVDEVEYEIGEPHQGDIVMLYYPLNPQEMFIKRVIAKEGDTVRVVQGDVYVNEQRLRDDYIPASFRSHEDWGPQRVVEGYYFVMGDHRNSSSDSREWGLVPKRYILGKVKVRWWPLQNARLF